MPPTDKKLEKLQRLLEVANEDYATPDDLVKAMEAILGIINTERDRITALVASKTAQGEAQNAKTLEYLNEKEKSLKYLISELGRAYSDDNELISAKFSKEIKRLEKKIPSKVDLTDIIAKIESLQEGVLSFPTELTANPEAIRDGLELLQGDERLNKDAIKGLDEWYDELLTLVSKNNGNNIVAGVRFLRYLADVNIDGIADGETLVWDAATQKFLPGAAGGGGGGSVTVTTPTGLVNGSNVTFTSSTVAKWIDTDTGRYYPNFGYTRSGTTYTLDLAPNSFIYLIS